MTDNQLFCECCGKELAEDSAVTLELDSYTNLYHKPGEIPMAEGDPPKRSQGCFFFGKTCAKKELQRTRKATTNVA